MRGYATAAVLLVASAGVAISNAADIERYENEGQFGDWIVLCDTEDDMGGTTYLDCVVQSASQPALVISALTDGPVLSLTDGPVLSFEGGAGTPLLTIADTAFDFSACPEGRCPFAGSTADFIELVSGNAAILDVGNERTNVSADGVGEAIGHAMDLID